MGIPSVDRASLRLKLESKLNFGMVKFKDLTCKLLMIPGTDRLSSPFKCREITGIRHDNIHCNLVAAVGQLYRLITVAFCITVARLIVHHRYRHSAAVKQVKCPVAGFISRKRIFPGRIEIDRIREHQPGAGSDGALRN